MPDASRSFTIGRPAAGTRGRSIARLAVATLLGLLLSGQAQAQGFGTGAPADSDQWQFQAGAYLFASGVKGDVGVTGVSGEVDIAFDEIWKQIDGAFMGFGEASYGDFAFVADGAYLDLEDSGTRVSSRGFVQATLDTTFKQTILAGYATYTIFDQTLNANSKERVFNFDVLAGARYNKLETDLGLSAAGLVRAGTASSTSVVDWTDPVIGLRATYVPLEHWFVSGWFDFGGFGVGAEQTWQGIGTVGYRFDNGIDLFAAYRAYHFNYKEGSGPSYFNMDMTYQGPEFGMAYRF